MYAIITHNNTERHDANMHHTTKQKHGSSNTQSGWLLLHNIIWIGRQISTMQSLQLSYEQ